MSSEQIIVFGVLILVLALFIWGRLRYDIVALLALMAVTITGIIPGEEAFTGFGHPAVITVAAVLVVSRGLMKSGVVDELVKKFAGIGDRPVVHVASLTALAAVASGFMNNVGSLALFMPVAIRLARKNNYSPSLLLMPLAFGSLLGGLTTLIGTPPNIIIATFRAETGADPFRMFDFTPVGLAVAVVGLIFIILLGWRLVPQRKELSTEDDPFQIEDYLAEVRIPEDSPLVDTQLRELANIAETEAVVVALIRDDREVAAPSSFEVLEAGDVLVVEADSRNLEALVDGAEAELVGTGPTSPDALRSDEVRLMEAVVAPGSPMIGESARSLNLRWRFGVNLLAVSRQGTRLHDRLGNIRFRVGDVLLMQGPLDTMTQTLSTLGSLPLAHRDLRLGQPRRIVIAIGIFGAALAIAALGLLPVQVAFIAAAISMLLANLLTLQEAYESIDWPIIVLLGAMIPVGQALEVSGGARLIANQVLAVGNQMSPVVALGILLVATMFLSDLVNNAAAAVLMAPIAITVADGMQASVDPFLMCVAIGASCAFLTPIGHQSNTLVMGPGGYRFGDYWRMGLPLEIIIVAVALPLVMLIWPPL